MLFSILKRKYSRKSKASHDKLILNILNSEEISTRKKLAKLRDKYSKIVYADKRDIFLNKLSDTSMLFSFMTLKKILRSWHEYVIKRKEDGYSDDSSKEKRIYKISEEEEDEINLINRQQRDINTHHIFKNTSLVPLAKIISK